MSTTQTPVPIAATPRAAKFSQRPLQRVLPLENGDHLTGAEFMRRYEAMPDLKKAELIDGVVYMGSPVRVDQHSRPDGWMHYWIADYSFRLKTAEFLSNTTLRLGNKDIPQPDCLMRLLPEHGGRSTIGKDGYLVGPVELVIEIAASTASYDVHKKKASYEKFNVLEYIAWRTEDQALNWWALENGKYVELLPDANGIIRSRIFPGLWLDVNALLAGDQEKVMAVLQQGIDTARNASK